MAKRNHRPPTLYPDWQVLAYDDDDADEGNNASAAGNSLSTHESERRPSGGCLRSPGRSPPRSPSEKKVRFADTLGYDLVQVVHLVLKSDSEIHEPTVLLQSEGIIPKHLDNEYRYLAATFPHPGIAEDFLLRVKEQKVCLEEALVPDMTILGTVRVANIGYEKSVKVRFSVDKWKRFYDIPASYVHNSCDGETDRFSFGLSLPQNITVGSRVEFAIFYQVNGGEYWDNNRGENYILACYPRTSNTSDSNGERWWHHFV